LQALWTLANIADGEDLCLFLYEAQIFSYLRILCSGINTCSNHDGNGSNSYISYDKKNVNEDGKSEESVQNMPNNISDDEEGVIPSQNSSRSSMLFAILNTPVKISQSPYFANDTSLSSSLS
jgi:hypothetical protein